MFVELKCKSNFSFLEGASHPEEYIEHAHALGYKALGLCDVNGLYAMPKAYWAARQKAHFKLIVGSELHIDKHPPITLLATHRRSYGQLCRLITHAHLDRPKHQALLQLSDFSYFKSQSEDFTDLVALLPASSQLSFFQQIFPYSFITISRHYEGKDTENTHKVIKFSKEYQIPIVATNDVHYHIPQRQHLHDIVTCVREGTSLNRAGYQLFANKERFLKSPQEMVELFKDLPEAITNTQKIADLCLFCPSELRYRYPSEWIPTGFVAQTYLEHLTWQGALRRYEGHLPRRVKQQLQHELNLIAQLQYADYFLTIYDIVEFAQSQNILCQGRGSAANSAVCFALGITSIDPIKMNLLFERFISAERDEPPDIDVDFEHERREEVLQYVYKKYGRNRAAMLSAVITYRKRSALRDVAKAFAIPVSTLSAKKVEKNFAQLAAQSPIKNSQQLCEQYAQELNGFPRHLSIHSGGFTLSADSITEIVPVEPASMDGRTIIQWDKYDLEYLGLLKVDLLSLGMLSAVKKCLDQLKISLHQIPQDDPATYHMICSAQTVGTFQIESRAQISMCGRMQAKNFYDLVIQIAMIRPGPILGGMVHPFLRRRRGLEKVTYPHPKLKVILQKTLGVPLFQEQVMKIAIELGGFTPGEADQLRRAIGSWRTTEEVERMGQRLMLGLKKNGLPSKFAEQVYNQVQGFSQYGFPESHSASFALIAYASCYLKCHYPALFIASLINSQPMGFYSNHTLIEEAKRFGVNVLPVDINKSQWDCLTYQNKLLMGWRVLKGLSQDEAEQIISNRPYFNLEDFLNKTNIRQHNLHRMALGGTFDRFEKDRRQALWRILDFYLKRNSLQLDLFSQPGLKYQGHQSQFLPMGELDSVKEDHKIFSLSTRAHPMEPLRKLLSLPKSTSRHIKKLRHGQWVEVAGLLLVFQRPATAKGVIFITLEDEFGFVDLILHAKIWEKYKEILDWQGFVRIKGIVQQDLHSRSVLVKNVYAFEWHSGEEYKGRQSRFFNR